MEQEPTLNLLELIYGLVERLMLTTEFDADELHDFIGAVRDNLDEVREQYNTPPPDGAQAVQELMVESLSLFDESFDEVFATCIKIFAEIVKHLRPVMRRCTAPA